MYFFHQYYLAVRAAGFEVSRPWLRGGPGSRPDTGARATLVRALRARRADRALLEVRRFARWVGPNMIVGDRPLALDCRKPGP